MKAIIDWEMATAEHIDYYRVLASWRLVAFAKGAYILQHRESIDSAYARGLETDVPNLLAEAAALIG